MGKKTVHEILDEVVDEFCDGYCKWPEKCFDEVKKKNREEDIDEVYLMDLAEDMLLETYCAKCPMNRL